MLIRRVEQLTLYRPSDELDVVDSGASRVDQSGGGIRTGAFRSATVFIKTGRLLLEGFFMMLFHGIIN